MTLPDKKRREQHLFIKKKGLSHILGKPDKTNRERVHRPPHVAKAMKLSMNVLPSQLNTQTNDAQERRHHTFFVSHTPSSKPNPAWIVWRGA
jgi:hypothetical protein